MFHKHKSLVLYSRNCESTCTYWFQRSVQAYVSITLFMHSISHETCTQGFVNFIHDNLMDKIADP